jgi:hypothetical protein
MRGTKKIRGQIKAVRVKQAVRKHPQATNQVCALGQRCKELEKYLSQQGNSKRG